MGVGIADPHAGGEHHLCKSLQAATKGTQAQLQPHSLRQWGWQTGADITALKAAAATGLPAGGQGLPNSMPRDAYNGASLTRLAARHGAPLTGASGIGARALLL